MVLFKRKLVPSIGDRQRNARSIRVGVLVQYIRREPPRTTSMVETFR